MCACVLACALDAVYMQTQQSHAHDIMSDLKRANSFTKSEKLTGYMFIIPGKD